MDESTNTIEKLQAIILDQANEQKQLLLSEARKEANEWLKTETDKLTQELSLILNDADKHALDARHRQLQTAEKASVGETLRLKNKLLAEALHRLREKLVLLREREDYTQILCGMIHDAATLLKTDALVLKFAAPDFQFTDKLLDKLKEILPNIAFSVSDEPQPISGGVIVASFDGKRQVNLDWNSVVQEMTDELAKRLFFDN